MNRCRLGRGTGLKTWCLCVFVVAFGVLCGRVADGQIAPGPLSRAHADLRGITGCGSCHDFGDRRLKCLECHVEIKRRVEAGTGFHARVYKSSPGATDCARCHPEHRGPKFDFLPLKRESFDHGAQVGFALEGKHKEQKCEACHTAARIAPTARQEIRMKNLNQTFLGLTRMCTSCHEEPHQKQLGADCLGCHIPQAWKPASRFNHSSAAFELTGMHQKVPCVKCHTRAVAGKSAGNEIGREPVQGGPGQKILLFKGLPHSGCQSCHADQHHGGFEALNLGEKCERCHNTSGWKSSWESNRAATGFSHNLSKFRLVGKHATVACDKCHKESNFGHPIPHDHCRDCHEGPHGTQFAARAAGSDCSSCHSPAGFKPALFDREAHTRGAFPLVGKHALLPCAKCHQPAGRGARYEIGKRLCQECHAEPHGGQFASAPNNNNCDLCHTPAGFAATTFSLERHANTQFPLTGKHISVACHKCHKPLAPAGSAAAAGNSQAPPAASILPAADEFALSDARRQFHFSSRACDTCHRDPHGFDPEAHLPCMTCHTPQGWRQLLPFDHSRTGFKLEGSHNDPARPIACVKCHTPDNQIADGSSRSVPSFSRASAQCSRCHAANDVHGGQFSAPGDGKRDCSQCHIPAAWKGGGFNHDTTRFVMNSAHRNLACVRCHKEQKEVNGRVMRTYRGTPFDCLKCH